MTEEKHLSPLVESKPQSGENVETIQATLTKFLTLVGGVLVALTALAYYTGWQSYTAYFARIGAPWAISSLQTSEYLIESSGLVSNILIIAFFAILLQCNGYVKPTYISYTALAVALVSFVLQRDFVTAWTITNDTSIQRNLVSINLTLLAAGFMLGQFCRHIWTSDQGLTPNTAYWAYTVLILCFAGLPAQMGTDRALHDLHPSSNSLPLVELLPAQANTPPWRLVHVFGQTGLLMSHPVPGVERQFRMIEIKNISIIHTSTTFKQF